MKFLSLIKKSKYVQVGHLYEHMYCNALKSLFYSLDLLRSVDYFISGKTYDDGYIVIEVELLTAKATENIDKIIKLEIEASDMRGVHFALQQIIAEEECILSSDVPKQLVEELATLNAKGWRIEDAIIEHKLEALLSDTGTPLAEHDELGVQTDTLALTTENSDYANIILANIQDRIATQLGHFEDAHRDTHTRFVTEFKVIQATGVVVNELEGLIHTEFKRINSILGTEAERQLQVKVDYRGDTRRITLG